ncbi:hypothetical protein PAAG_11380 [Paracoccidioides lutzii Pb01]|uniref:Uncharacterized protein n=1 Tax=Paracoccidioides lutzii (strain ATCC MYA-826 / Pb01) TaxID=502779 RepID=A0A0A2V2U4_PARBA|nr:hypothetical protein PAAG_11380 [Paracoccidioides lutzii Pb01]KGQ01808.1 hypothetical protein PAAG_11380 [Paracoccidioides lutzii Pb01]
MADHLLTLMAFHLYPSLRWQELGLVFKTLGDTVAEHGIQTEDIYNFDETGFAMGSVQLPRSSPVLSATAGQRFYNQEIENV